ncbi:PREDICTED: uncharacterized protein LOC104704078 [Camelina sativa]|uniref:Uncharacterized protein LOC104704078 n=1 Tax=Camelina sativa TaxID=90675 RepID=A0ABM0SZS4_CAMSA|nr:PREDICTED: uncharacterized protein LOC104704078 [Camelina sativa]
MGNCMERWVRGDQGEEGKIEVREREKESFKLDGGDSEDGHGGMKVKIVLSRHELDMFLLEMNRNHDGNLKITRDVMVELEKRILRASSLSSLSSSMAWEPSLESIVECPEVQEMDRS